MFMTSKKDRELIAQEIARILDYGRHDRHFVGFSDGYLEVARNGTIKAFSFNWGDNPVRADRMVASIELSNPDSLTFENLDRMVSLISMG